MVDERAEQDPSKAPTENAEVALSREDEASIRSLAEELHESAAVVAQSYARELEPLRSVARVTTFLPLVVSRLVRRRHFEARRVA